MKLIVTNSKFTAVFTIFIVALFSITYVACNKDNNTTTFSSENKEVENRYKLKGNLAPVEELIERGDNESVVINKAEYELSKVLVKLAIDKKFTDFIIQTAKQNRGVVKYGQVFEEFPHYMQNFQGTILANRFDFKSNNPKPLKTRSGGDYDFIHTGYGYESVIFVPNYENQINNNYPIVAPELEIEDDDVNENYDIIYAMEVQSNGSYREVNVGEYDAAQTSSAIMVTSLVTTAELNPQPTLEGAYELLKSEGLPLGVRANPVCQSNTYTIKVFYDQSCSQELYAAGAEYINTPNFAPFRLQKGIGINPLNENQPGVNNWRLISMKANECGKPLFVFFGGSGCSSTARVVPNLYAKDFYTILGSAFSADHFVYYNVYERDWYCSNKTLGTLKFQDGTANRFEGRRRYHDEWLAFNPGTIDDNVQGSLSNIRNARFPTGSMHLSGQTVHNFDNGKGSLLFKRENR